MEVRFIDLDWAGYLGVAKYPPFINQRIDWGMPEPVGKLIGWEHDAYMLNKSLDALRQAQALRGPSKAGGGAAQACALTRPLVRRVAAAASVASRGLRHGYGRLR